MPIGKLLILPEVTSSVNFKKRLEREAEAEAKAKVINEGVDHEVLPLEVQVPDGDGDLRPTVSSPHMKKNEIIDREDDTSKGGSHPDGDHAISDDTDLQRQVPPNPEQLQLELQKWIKLYGPVNPGEFIATDGDVLVPVYLSKESFLHKSYSTSETSIGSLPHIPNCSANVLNASCSSTASDTAYGEQPVPVPEQASSSTCNNTILHDEVQNLEQKNFALLEAIHEKNKIIQQFQLSIHELSNHKLANVTSVQDICALMREFAKQGQSTVETQAVLLTTTPETNQLVVGGLAGYLGAYALKNFGKSLCMAISGGTFLLSVGYQRGYVGINWKKIQEDLGLEQQQTLNGTSSSIGAFEIVKRTQLLNKYPYAIGGLLVGLCTGLLS